MQAQKALESILADVKSVDGVKSVERIVCGGCLDFKVITSLPAEKFGEWEEKGFAPESDFLEKLKGIDGVSLVETQTFTVSSFAWSPKLMDRIRSSQLTYHTFPFFSLEIENASVSWTCKLEPVDPCSG